MTSRFFHDQPADGSPLGLRREGSVGSVTAAAPHSDSADLPLTPLQAGMVYESVFSGRPGVNLEQVVIHLPGPVDTESLQAAWQMAVDRHPALRRTLHLDGAQGPLQREVPQAVLPDIARRDLPPGGLSAFLAADRAAGADPALWPNWRLQLVPGEGAAQVLVWTFPHAILDGRSFGTVLTRVFATYDALRRGQALLGDDRDTDPAPHYRKAAGETDPAALAHFMAHLDGVEPQGLPSHLRAGGATPIGAEKITLEQHLEAAQTAALTHLAQAHGATLNTVLNAAWGLVLARHAGRDTALFGIARSGRHLVPQAEDMVGCLINTLPLAVRIAPGQSLGALLAQIRADQIAMRPHEGCALTAIRAALGLPGQQPLFDSLVVYERHTLADRLHALGGDWPARRVELHEEGALPLTLAAYGEDRLFLRLEHDPSQLAPGAGPRLFSHLLALLGAMAQAQGDTPLCALNMLPVAEETAVLALAGTEVGTGIAQTPPDPPLQQIARQPPESCALIGPDGATLDFGALHQQVARLAATFAAKGLAPGQIVGLCLPRGPDYIAALLAVWHSGAAALPLDPAYPPEALTHMMQDSGAGLLICAERAPWMQDFNALPLAEATAPAAQDHIAPAHTRPETTAYVIYTSGTTGRPKGVAVSHAALAAHSAAAIRWLGLTPRDRVLQFTSLSFDVSLEEIVPTLAVGATLCLRPEAAAQDPRLLVDFIIRHQITVLNLPTGFWQALTDHLELTGARLPPSVRRVIVGGERVPPAALRRWHALHPGIDWSNGYGPTEATITAAAFDLPAGTAPPETDEVPVGRPLDHARLYVLAPDLSLAPMGAEGELWIGGPCVATGYLGKPAETAERFLPDPWAPSPQGRMYRSGDLAAWDAQGRLMLAGRADRQLKLRGYRIEPAEIERAVERLPGVAQALVAMLDAGQPRARLVAWARPTDPAAPPQAPSLEAALAAVLPPQMRPAVLVVQDWPMRPGGKIDMARLPRPAETDDTAPATDSRDDSPRLQAMRAHFAVVLDLPDVGADADFFRLGGHSLLLIRLITRIAAHEGATLSIADIHAGPTPRALAALLETGGSTTRSLRDCILPIQPRGSRVPIYGVHVLGINGSYYRPLSEILGPDQPLFGLTVGYLDDQTPIGVTETAALYHRVLSQHQPQGPLTLVAVSLGAYVAFELAQRLLAEGRDVRMLVLLDASGPGGRPQLGPVARLSGHWQRLRHEGAGYVTQKLGARVEEALHRIEQLRLRLGKHFGAPGVNSVKAFTAANELAVRAYTPRPYPRRLTVIRATGNASDAPEAIESGLGWAPVAAAGFDLHEVEGDHLTMLEPPFVDQLAPLLAQDPAENPYSP